MPSLFHENRYGFSNGKTVCGVDEAGRGPLAGPVTAAAVILPLKLPQAIKKEIRDSKKMTALQREELFDPLMQTCRCAVAEASIEEIDRFNILWASMLAMQRAVEKLQAQIDMALIDGNRAPPQLPCPAATVIKGDDKSYSIAAASIIAKVTRDRFMKKLAAEHPGYGWEHNFGYGTPEHLEALQKLGPTKWHRDSFAPVYQLSLLTK